MLTNLYKAFLKAQEAFFCRTASPGRVDSEEPETVPGEEDNQLPPNRLPPVPAHPDLGLKTALMELVCALKSSDTSSPRGRL